MKSNTTRIAQISDCHLFADIESLHHGINVYDNLVKVVQHIVCSLNGIGDNQNTNIELIIFTGDLTQDHSELSYQRFVEVFEQQKRNTPIFNIPVYYLSGNHDETNLLNKYLSSPPFIQDKTINLKHWQIQLIESKSDTPAGEVTQEELTKLGNNIVENKNQLLFMHHHPIDVGYFIDKHGLTNQQDFWQAMTKLNRHNMIKGIACGHIHRGLNIPTFSASKAQCIDVFTCPATSIQFDPTKLTVSALPKGAGYRVFTLHDNGQLKSEDVYILIDNQSE